MNSRLWQRLAFLLFALIGISVMGYLVNEWIIQKILSEGDRGELLQSAEFIPDVMTMRMSEMISTEDDFTLGDSDTEESEVDANDAGYYRVAEYMAPSKIYPVFSWDYLLCSSAIPSQLSKPAFLAALSKQKHLKGISFSSVPERQVMEAMDHIGLKYVGFEIEYDGDDPRYTSLETLSIFVPQAKIVAIGHPLTAAFTSIFYNTGRLPHHLKLELEINKDTERLLILDLPDYWGYTLEIIDRDGPREKPLIIEWSLPYKNPHQITVKTSQAIFKYYRTGRSFNPDGGLTIKTSFDFKEQVEGKKRFDFHPDSDGANIQSR